jgi:sugar lactone lactonase YvrE
MTTRTAARSRRWAAALGCLAAAACADAAAEPRGLATDTLENGAVRVRNPERGTWTEQTAWRAVEEARLGRADGAGAEVFAMPAALEVDAAGRLYVLDAQAGEVRVFAPDWTHLRSFGRPGAGPGELAQAMGMTFAPDGTLWVVDPGNARFTVFDTAGTVVATHRRPNGFAVYPWPGRFDRAGRLWDVAQGGGLGAAPALVRMEPGTGRTERFPLPAFTPDQFTRGADLTARVPFSPELAWALDDEGRVWSGVTDRYRLRLHRPGGDTMLVIERAARPVDVTAAERDSVPASLKWFTDQGGRVDLGRVPRSKPAFASVRTDDRGWLWVRPALPAGERRAAFDVFDPQGRYGGRVTLPVEVPDEMPLVVRGDRIYAVTLAEAGYPQVVRLRITNRHPAPIARLE